MVSTAPESDATPPVTPDAQRGWIDALPAGVQPFARLARLDRPAGSWLLFWPCAWGVALAGGLATDGALLLWFGIGSLAMRAAGCVWNDIIDRDLDRQVARTRARPVASTQKLLTALIVAEWRWSGCLSSRNFGRWRRSLPWQALCWSPPIRS